MDARLLNRCEASARSFEAVNPFVNEQSVFPKRTGLMILPGMTLFPHSLLPLYIFEERYRQMVEQALGGERMFAIAHVGEDGDVAPIGGIGIVRACVANDDGTSNLILQGIARVNFSDIEMEPFPSAAVAVLVDTHAGDDSLADLRSDIDKVYHQIREAGSEAPAGFDQYLAQIDSPGAFADAISAAFVADPVERRGLLEECDVSIRMQRLLRCLVRQMQTL